MRLSTIAIVLPLAAIAVSPASANYFSNFMFGSNHFKPMGSAPSPRPDDLRAMGDSKYGAGKTYAFSEKDGHWHEVRPSRDDKNAGQAAKGDKSAQPDGAAANAPVASAEH